MFSVFYMVLGCTVLILGVAADSNSTVEEYSYVVGVETVNLIERVKKECTGTVIDKQWVLTGGHCMGGKLFPSTTVIHTPKNKPEVHIKADQSFIHRSGIALLKLNSPIDVTPVNLPKEGDRLEIGVEVTVMGWNKRLVGNNFKVADSKPCRNILDLFFSKLLPTAPPTICVYNNGAKACYGDEGGPLLLDNVLYGITMKNPSIPPFIDYILTWYPACWEPTVFLPVGNYLSWIEETMQNNA